LCEKVQYTLKTFQMCPLNRNSKDRSSPSPSSPPPTAPWQSATALLTARGLLQGRPANLLTVGGLPWGRPSPHMRRSLLWPRRRSAHRRRARVRPHRRRATTGTGEHGRSLLFSRWPPRHVRVLRFKLKLAAPKLVPLPPRPRCRSTQAPPQASS
jgi:hypothetical protein